MATPTKTIHDLDDKILHHLFGYLRLEDKLKLALISNSNHFTEVIDDLIRDEVLDLSLLQMAFTVDEARLVLSKYGHSIRRFRSISTFDDDEKIEYAKLAASYCPNIEEISLIGYEIKIDNAYGMLLAKSSNATSLKLKKCALGNAACSLLQKLHRLQLIDLEGSKLTGKGLNKLENIIHLNLKNCRNFKCKNFIDICRSNKLKTLNIAGLKQSTCGALRTLIATQSDLETLVLGDKYWMKDPDQFCKVGCLREVSLLGCYERTLLSYIKELAAHRMDKLESLEINLPLIFSENTDKLMASVDGICEFSNLRILSFRNCMLYENTDLIKIGKACRKLEMLDLQGSSFTDMGVLGCVENLENLRHLDISYCELKRNLFSRLVEDRKTQKDCLLLVVYIKPKMELAEILKSEEYINCRDIVALSMEPMRLSSDTSILTRLDELNSKKINNCRKLNSHSKASKQEPLATRNLSLLDLDDNCLYEIIKYLAPIQRLTLILTTKRCDHIFKYFLRTDLFDIIKIMSNFTARQATEIFSRCGFMMKRILMQTSAYHFDIEYFNLVEKYCNNIEELHFYDIHLDPCVKTGAKIIGRCAESLKIIKMKYWDVEDSVALEISKAKNLNTLILKGSSVSGAHLDLLTNIKKLDLGKCSDLLAVHFNKMCHSNRFQELDIRGCSKIDSSSFQTLVDTQTELERLTLGGVYSATNIHVVSGLKKLVDISLRQCIPQEVMEVLNNFSEQKRKEIRFIGVKYSGELTATMLPNFRECTLNFPNLIYLRLPTLSVVDNAYIKRIAKACPLLEILDVHSASNLTDEGILEAIESLKQLRHFDIKYCLVNSYATIYQRSVEIKKRRKDNFPLKLYVQSESETLYSMLDTKEYETLKNYVILSDEWVHDLDKAIYEKERNRRHALERKSKPVEQHGSTITKNQTSLLDLPDNCLLKIATQLDPIDKLKLVFTSNRLLQLIKPLVSDILFDVNEIARSFTLSETRYLLSRCDRDIRRLQFKASRMSGPIEYLQLFQPFCNNLREIRINEVLDLQLNEIGKLFSPPDQKLEKLSFKHGYQLDSVLAEITNKKGESVNPFENLIELHFYDCEALMPEQFIEFCQNCKLKRLDIRSCKLLRNEDFTTLVGSQSETLEWLGLSCEYTADNFSDVALLSSLRHICIDVYEGVKPLEVLLDKLVKYRRNDLLTMELTNREHRTLDYNIINQIVEERCKMFANLKEIVINHPKPYIKPYQYE